MENKTGIGLLLEKIGNFFEGLFNAAAKAYNGLQPEVQNALKNGSEILSIINRNVTEAPEFVIELIEKAVPGLTRENLLVGLNKVANGLNAIDAIEANTLEETILNLQKHLESVKGETWAGVSSLAAKLLAFALAPKGTKWDTFESIMVWVYQTFIRTKFK